VGRPDPLVYKGGVHTDAEADMVSAEASTAICVQRFDDSRNSAIHTTYRISLRSSSLREPRYPLLRVVFVSSTSSARSSQLQTDNLVGCVGWLPTPGWCAPKGARLPRETAARAFQRSARGVLSSSRVDVDGFNDPSAGSPTETLLRLLLPLNGRV
jgi:hypothetical protein